MTRLADPTRGYTYTNAVATTEDRNFEPRGYCRDPLRGRINLVSGTRSKATSGLPLVHICNHTLSDGGYQRGQVEKHGTYEEKLATSPWRHVPNAGALKPLPTRAAIAGDIQSRAVLDPLKAPEDERTREHVRTALASTGWQSWNACCWPVALLRRRRGTGVPPRKDMVPE